MTVGPPAIKLLNGNGENANSTRDENAAFNQVIENVFMAGQSNSHDDKDAATRNGEADQGAKQKDYHSQRSFHNRAH
jgi:hypothetical protein